MPGEASASSGSVGAEAAPTVRLPVAVLAVLATVVVALLAVWGSTAVDAARLPTGPALAPPEAPPAATSFTLEGRRAIFEEFRVTLAGPPYVCQAPDQPPSPAFSAFLLCAATVHADFDAAGHDWVASTGVALLDDSVVRPELTDTAEQAAEALVDVSYAAEDNVRLSEQKGSIASISAPAGSAVSYEAKVNVQRKGLETPYDKLVVVVVKLESGRHVMFFSEFPHDGSKATLKAVVASVGSISARS